jgi:wyosine [tRNA(Phe)-imidazoG37] synthetase (radical SAM superfamily)
VPHKVCCYDCVYCQLGRTTRLTAQRERFADPDQVARQVEQALAQGPAPEVITLAGSGEPTLELELERLIAALRRVAGDLPLCLLTNGGLLWHEEVIRAALAVDLVYPSLDAADPETFARVNRPAAELPPFEEIVAGLSDLCRRRQGRGCRLEVMLVQGLNDSPASLDALAAQARSLEVEVDLNTVVRPPAEAGVQRLDQAALEQARERFGGRAQIIAPFGAPRDARRSPGRAGVSGRILALVARRPCTARDLALALGLPEDEVEAICVAAVEWGKLAEKRLEGAVYYTLRG